MYTSSALKAKQRGVKFFGTNVQGSLIIASCASIERSPGIRQQVKEFEAEKSFIRKENSAVSIPWPVKLQATNGFFHRTAARCQQHEEITKYLAERWNYASDILKKQNKNEEGCVELYKDKCPERHPVYEAFDLDSWIRNRLQHGASMVRSN